METWLIWLIAALLCILIELCTSGFAIACFAVGAIFASILAGANIGIVWQIVAFAIGSIAAFIFIRPLALKYLHKNDKMVTGVEALIGRIGTVSETINADGYGRVAIDGDDWKAKEIDGKSISKGTNVKIINIDSVILTVKAE